MALIIYSNAIIEELSPNNLVFTEDEIINIFGENYHTLHSKRITEIPNCWAAWGTMDNPANNEYNLIGSEIIDFDIDSPLLIIHDSEINPEWRITDDIILKNYDDFHQDITKHINKVAADVLKKEQDQIENGEKEDSRITLKQLGITLDKKLLFSFDLDSQAKDFFTNTSFFNFSKNILNYLTKNYDNDRINKKPFTIFDDNKTVVVVEEDKVEATLDKIIKTFEEFEHYENCQLLHAIKEKWINSNKEIPQKKKRGRPKKL